MNNKIFLTLNNKDISGHMNNKDISDFVGGECDNDVEVMREMLVIT